MTIRWKRLRDTAYPTPPTYETEGAAGMDVRADCPDGVYLTPGARHLFPTGWAVALPFEYELQCRPRSGLAANQGVTVLNAPGTVDSDYRGEIKVCLINHSAHAVTINHHDRIAQLVLAPIARTRSVVVEDLGETARGAGGFGSTGRN